MEQSDIKYISTFFMLTIFSKLTNLLKKVHNTISLPILLKNEKKICLYNHLNNMLCVNNFSIHMYFILYNVYIYV